MLFKPTNQPPPFSAAFGLLASTDIPFPPLVKEMLRIAAVVNLDTKVCVLFKHAYAGICTIRLAVLHGLYNRKLTTHLPDPDKKQRNVLKHQDVHSFY